MQRWLASNSLLIGVLFLSPVSSRAADVRVVVWDEQQPAQKQAYDDFLGNAIAAHLKSKPGFVVRSMKLDDAEQGLSAETLDFAQVLIWWGHVRHREIKPEKGREIVERIKAGRLSLIALHSAHWSTPFVESMYERTRQDAARLFPETGGRKVTFEFVAPPQTFTVPAHGSLLTPAYYAVRRGGRDVHVRVDLPNCCFPDYRADGAPSTVAVLKPDHPVAAGLPKSFTIPRTEMYNDPFHVPPADDALFEESWAKGEKFRSGLIWKIGEGRVFYFRPGHETYDVYKQPEPLRVIENATRWLGGGS
ncbi:MAG TPA: ThuA domain-containing protein [Pirellulaceae bacterium]|nr:ThuA domain-containing protein [Pirellulaceae bacterium]